MLDWRELGKKTSWLMAIQEQVGIGFDAEAAEKLVEQLSTEMEYLTIQVEASLPERPLKQAEISEWSMPQKPFKMDGTESAHMVRFRERTGYTGKAVSNQCIKESMPMTIGNQEDIKNWLIAEGWEPTLWNYKKGPNGKPERGPDGDYVKTSPKMQDKGKLCPNLEDMEGDLVRSIVRFLSLRNRFSVVTSWLQHPRLGVDGRLPSGSAGITNTNRQRHKIVANIPKAEEGVIYGKEMRGLFTAKRGAVFVGWDASGLEARVEGHYTYKYDNGAYARELLEGDIHSKNARVFYPEDTERLGSDEPSFKPFRSKSKNGKYALSYGCSPKKLASTLGVSEFEGEILYDNFWEANTALSALKSDVEKYWKAKKSLVAIDGRPLVCRSKHSLINTLFQSCGAIVMDISGLYMDKYLNGIKYSKEEGFHYLYKGYVVKRVIFYHDEYIFECPEEIAEEIGELGVMSIVKAGEIMKLRVPLSGEYKIGHSWGDIH